MISILKKSTPHLRPMEESDLLEVAHIEQGTFPDPWPLNSFHECLAFGHRCLVLEQHGIIQAYGIMSIEIGSAHILNFCVRQELRQRGIGRQMLHHLVEVAERAQVEAIFLEVRASNHPAIQLYYTTGFVQVGVRKDYYPSGTGPEDALILMRELPTD
ncbi:MAG: ribosomal protein S18-alanine N-acetyltransferase [Acidobacteriota bacterium]|nr:ribosomal protein S18-alanine N-acetyltransferase [Acidobacteriota bacterium]